MRVPTFIKGDLLQVQTTSHIDVPGITNYQPPRLFISRHQIPWLGKMDKIAWTKRLIDYPTHQSYF
jgi:hypothetical protein